MQCISNKDENNKFFKKGKISLKLNLGEYAFRSIIDRLKNLSSLSELEYNTDLVIDLSEVKDEKGIQTAINQKIKELKLNYSLVDGYFDMINDADLGILMQVVDDNQKFNGKRSDLILNKDLKYVGIATKSLETTIKDKLVKQFFACYIYAK